MRLNEHMEHLEGAVVFQDACKMGLEGIVLEAPRFALPVGTFPRLAEVQESVSTGGDA